MKLGEIKLEALKLMWANYNEDIGIEQLSDLMGSERYGDYLVAMSGSINRCFADLEARGILPVKSFALAAPLREEKGRTAAYDLKELIGDYLSFERLIYETEGGSYEDTEIGAQIEEDILYLPWFDGEKEEYRVIYRPRLPHIFPYTNDETELRIPDRIAAFIPYWIKGELYREEEPNEAGEARNWYEAQMSAVASVSSRRQGSVRSVYSMTEV